MLIKFIFLEMIKTDTTHHTISILYIYFSIVVVDQE